MSSDRLADVGKLAWLPAGRRTKWAVLLFWLVVAGFAFAPSSLLMGAEKNDAIAWLPASAESTKVIQAAEQFQSKDEIPTLVVYERAAGMTPQDVASVTAQVAKFNAAQQPREANRSRGSVSQSICGSGGCDVRKRETGPEELISARTGLRGSSIVPE